MKKSAKHRIATDRWTFKEKEGRIGVRNVRRDANDVVQTAYLQPAAQLDKLEFLLVILDYEGGLPPIEQQPVDCGTGGTLPQGEQPCLSPTPVATPSRAPSPKP